MADGYQDKALTLRLPAEVMDQVRIVAKADGMTISELVRVAIVAHIDRRRADPKFQRGLQARIERYRELLPQSGRSS